MGRAKDPDAAQAAAVQVVRTLRDAGHQAFFAGGCVRDALLGEHPTDFDVATSATPPQVRALFRSTHEVGQAFGVVLVHIADALIEVATFRSEGVYSDKRRPDTVTFSDAQADAKRRDFTINALFMDPLGVESALPVAARHAMGNVIDLVGGLADLEHKVIRAVGAPDDRLAEDHLRALRAARFAARFAFTIEEGTARAIRNHAAELQGVSRERVGEEIRRMFEHPARAAAARMLESLSLDAPTLEEASLQSQPRTLGALTGPSPFPVALAAWAIDRAAASNTELSDEAIKSLLPRWRRALCLSNDDRDALRDVLQDYLALTGPWPTLSVARQKRLAGSRWFASALALASARHSARVGSVQARLAELGVSEAEFGHPPEPLVSGDDLIGIGLVPGPPFKALLDRLYDAQLEKRIASKAEGLELARRSGV